MKKLLKILIVSATKDEIAPFVQQAGLRLSLSSPHELYTGMFSDHHINVLITGASMMQTAFCLADCLNRDSYDVAINVGIAGSFDDALPIGETVQIATETLGDLGAESPNGFIAITQMPFFDANKYPYTKGILSNPNLQLFNGLAALPQVNGLSVNATSGTTQSITERLHLFSPQVETMESAAFFYACLWHKIKFCSIRTISNRIEVRNTQNWNIGLAINNLNTQIAKLLDS